MTLVFKKNILMWVAGTQFALLGVGYAIKAPDIEKANKQAEQARTEATDSTYNKEIALTRAETCQLLVLDKPLVEGAEVYQSKLVNGVPQLDLTRPLPKNTPICDGNGFTAITKTKTVRTKSGRLQTVSIALDIAAAPVEQINEVLEQRGLLQSSPSPTPQP